MILYERLGNFMSKTYIHYGHSSFDRESFNHIKRHGISTKPSGGLWGSPIKAKYGWKIGVKTMNLVNVWKKTVFVLN